MSIEKCDAVALANNIFMENIIKVIHAVLFFL